MRQTVRVCGLFVFARIHFDRCVSATLTLDLNLNLYLYVKLCRMKKYLEAPRIPFVCSHRWTYFIRVHLATLDHARTISKYFHKKQTNSTRAHFKSAQLCSQHGIENQFRLRSNQANPDEIFRADARVRLTGWLVPFQTKSIKQMLAPD